MVRCPNLDRWLEWPKLSAPVTLEEAERSHILQTLQQTEGVVGGPNGAAARLGLPRTTLISKMKRLGINRGQSSVLPVRAVASVPISDEANFSDPSAERNVSRACKFRNLQSRTLAWEGYARWPKPKESTFPKLWE